MLFLYVALSVPTWEAIVKPLEEVLRAADRIYALWRINLGWDEILRLEKDLERAYNSIQRTRRRYDAQDGLVWLNTLLLNIKARAFVGSYKGLA